MAEKKSFDLSALIGSVPELGTERQQITYIPIDKILPNGENFYSLDGLDELAGSIETLGLQQPLLVRPIEGGKYELISGHRRRAAILMIRDSGSQQFAEGVPCIVDESDDSPAVRKFKLLMANNDTRKMTSADQNKQAEELENVLRELEDEGYQFSGRLRDWVAKLSGMSRSKLNRLKVIRDKLRPDIKEKYYDTGKLNESCAYELAQMPHEEQIKLVALANGCGKGIERLYASDISEFVKDKQRFTDQKCPMSRGETCSHVDGLLAKLYDGSYSYKPCRYGANGCCAKCSDYLNCKYRCPKLDVKAKAERAKNKAEKADERARQKAKDEHDVRMIEHVWARYGQALRRAGKTDKQLREELAKDQRTWGEFNCYLSNSTQQALLDYENADATPLTALPYGHNFKVWDYVRLVKYADALGVSLDYLFLRSEDPEGGKAKDAAPAPEPDEDEGATFVNFSWRIGGPAQNAEGWYVVKAKICGNIIARKVLYWKDERWYLNDLPTARQIDSDVEVVCWFPLPEEEGV